MSNQKLTSLVQQFRNQGYIILPDIFSKETISLWKKQYQEQLTGLAYMRGGQSSYWMMNMLERDPGLIWPAATNSVLVDFAECVLGPFVQLSSVVLAGFPPFSQERKGAVSAWHRDRLFGNLPMDGLYIRPNALVVMSYMQDLNEFSGQLRVIPGSHLLCNVMEIGDKHSPHPAEHLLSLKAGHAIVFHDNFMHSGSANIADEDRCFFGITYNLTWMKQEDNFEGPNCQLLLERARQERNYRHMRLLGVDEKRQKRLNSGLVEPTEEQLAQWAAEDQQEILSDQV